MAWASVALLSTSVLLGSCANAADAKPDLTTTEGACAAVADAIEKMKSDDPDQRAAGAALAARIWNSSGSNDEVDNGMRRSCAGAVIEMLHAAGIDPNN